MYEIELRALIDDFEDLKNKLDSFATPISLNEREATIFFTNGNGFDLRLRLRKDKFILNYKETLTKKARKEIESEVSNPNAIYHLLLHSGFKIRNIVARVKYSYRYENYEILLNRIIDWGDAVEVEVVIGEEKEVDLIETSIKKFMADKLGIFKLLDNQMLESMNAEYGKNIDFDKIKVDDLVDYVSGKVESIKFI